MVLLFLNVILLFVSGVHADEAHLDITTYDLGNTINDLCISGNKVICATGFGLIAWDRSSLSYEKIDIYNSPTPGYQPSMSSVAANSQGHIMAEEIDSRWMTFFDGSEWSMHENGIFNNQHNCLFADSSGLFWGGTGSDGFYSWDGADSTVYSGGDGLLNVTDITAGDDGVIWFATKGGVLCIDGGKVHSYTVSNGLPNNDVTCVFISSSAIWAGTKKGAARYNGDGTWTAYTYNEGLVNNIVVDIVGDHDGNIWVATIGGVSRFDGETWDSFTKENELMDDRVTSMAVDNEGRVWFCTSYDDKGITVYEDGEFIWYTRYDGKLPVHEIHAVANDSDGNIWIGWDEGLARLENGNWLQYTKADGMAGDGVIDLWPGGNGSLWVRFDNSSSAGISRYQDGVWRTYTTTDGFPVNRPNFVYEMPDGTLWICSFERVQKLKDFAYDVYSLKKNLLSDTILDIDEAPDGTLWLGTDKGLTRFDGESYVTWNETEGLLSNLVTSVETAPDGSVWCLAYHKYLIHFDGISFHRIQSIDDTWSGLFSDIEIDDDGVLWGVKNYLLVNSFVSDGYDPEAVPYPGDAVGLYSFDGAAWRYHPFPDDDMWSSVDPVKIVCDPDDVVWIATESGLARFDGESWTLLTVNGPVNSQINAVAVDQENVKWFATHGGISSFDGLEWRHYVLRDIYHPNPEYRSLVISFDRIYVDPLTNKKWFIAGIPFSRVVSFDGREFEYHMSMEANTNYTMDRDGVFWAVNEEGVISYHEAQPRQYTVDDGLSEDLIPYRSVYIDRNNTKWFFSFFGLTGFDGKTFTHYTSYVTMGFSAIADDSAGNLWFLYRRFGVSSFYRQNNYYYLPEYNSRDYTYYSMAVMPDDTVWVAHSGGLSMYDGEEWALCPDIVPVASWNPVLHVDVLGRLWIIESDSVSIYDGKVWQHMNSYHLNSGNIMCCSDMDGSLWLRHSSGILNVSAAWKDVSSPALSPIRLLGNYPNPFNEGTAVEFELGEWGYVDLVIYNILGQKVREMKNIPKPVGKSAILWDGRGDSGGRVSSGTYFYRLEKDGVHAKGRMMFVK